MSKKTAQRDHYRSGCTVFRQGVLLCQGLLSVVLVGNGQFLTAFSTT